MDPKGLVAYIPLLPILLISYSMTKMKNVLYAVLSSALIVCLFRFFLILRSTTSMNPQLIAPAEILSVAAYTGLVVAVAAGIFTCEYTIVLTSANAMESKTEVADVTKAAKISASTLFVLMVVCTFGMAFLQFASTYSKDITLPSKIFSCVFPVIYTWIMILFNRFNWNKAVKALAAKATQEATVEDVEPAEKVDSEETPAKDTEEV